MCDIECNFSSYIVNFGGLNFFEGFIPSISNMNGIWYLDRSCSFCTDLEIMAFDHAGKVDIAWVLLWRPVLPSSHLLPRFCLASEHGEGPHQDQFISMDFFIFLKPWSNCRLGFLPHRSMTKLACRLSHPEMRPVA